MTGAQQQIAVLIKGIQMILKSGGERRNTGAGAQGAFDEPFAVKQVQRLPHRVTADLELLHQLTF
ncbi:hypothetical protein SDC9_184735 [bioreactor metagenome]|uniref:Uncharacterized protein n=1 Tax=bioreactor metagenome TaxID=1076179 RepID=A0A645HGC0_9ZZZZ